MYLDNLVESTKVRVAKQKQEISIQDVRKQAEQMVTCKGKLFEENLRKKGMSFICEVKKASPSKGVITDDFPYLEIAQEYERAGAAGVSVLTEPDYFLGSDKYLSEISAQIGTPVLRKDFTVDAYQIYEAKTLGASAILLISELLEKEQLRDYLQLATSIGLSVLTESHSFAQMEKSIAAGATILGVNNRNLESFEVDLETSIRLRSFAPKECIFVSESGIKGEEDIKKLRKHGIDAVLIGETLMRSQDREGTIARWAKCEEDKN